VLVVLDTTVLLADVDLRSVGWRVLVQATAAWDVRIAVPEIVVLEAVAGYRRFVDDTVAGLNKLYERHLPRVGRKMEDSGDAAKAVLLEAAESYEDQLRQTLAELSVQLAAPAEVGHLEVARRATSRQRPFDANGSGYRDTLNWLTLITLAKAHEAEHVIWVSDNSQDFGDEGGNELHPDLSAELTADGLDGRVTWCRNVQQLALLLAAEYRPAHAEDIARLQEHLRGELLKNYIHQAVNDNGIGMNVDPRECALPIATVSAKIREIKDFSEPDLTVRGSAADREAVAEFRLTGRTTMVVELTGGTTSAMEGDVRVISRGQTKSSGISEKILAYSGLVTLDAYGRPTGAELTKIAAEDSDPGRAMWSIMDNADLFDPRTGSIFEMKTYQLPQQPDYAKFSQWLQQANLNDPPTPGGFLGFLLILYAMWQARDKQAKSDAPKESRNKEGEDNSEPDSPDDVADDQQDP
jgi:hypothetical protein